MGEACTTLRFLWEETLAIFTSGHMTRNKLRKTTESGDVASHRHELLAFGIPGIREKGTLLGAFFGFKDKTFVGGKRGPLKAPFRYDLAFIEANPGD